jgi:WhiB family redox-sensing transcriptional regulator
MLSAPWWHRAACNDRKRVDPNWFHPDRGGTPEPALAVCRRCPVVAACLEDALEEEACRSGGPFGVRGGLAAKQRGALVRQRRRAAGERESVGLQRMRRLAAAGLSYERIGEELGLGRGAVGARLRRAAIRDAKAKLETVGGKVR